MSKLDWTPGTFSSWWNSQPRPQGLLLDDFQNGGSSPDDPLFRKSSRRRPWGRGWWNSSTYCSTAAACRQSTIDGESQTFWSFVSISLCGAAGNQQPFHLKGRLPFSRVKRSHHLFLEKYCLFHCCCEMTFIKEAPFPLSLRQFKFWYCHWSLMSPAPLTHVL